MKNKLSESIMLKLNEGITNNEIYNIVGDIYDGDYEVKVHGRSVKGGHFTIKKKVDKNNYLLKNGTNKPIEFEVEFFNKELRLFSPTNGRTYYIERDYDMDNFKYDVMKYFEEQSK